MLTDIWSTFVSGLQTKLHTIESIQNLRDSDVSISKDLVDTFINESNLPWPGFFKGLEITNDGMVLKSVQYLNKMIFCKVEGIKDFLVPYNNNYFYYNNGNLELINDSLTT